MLVRNNIGRFNFKGLFLFCDKNLNLDLDLALSSRFGSPPSSWGRVQLRAGVHKLRQKILLDEFKRTVQPINSFRLSRLTFCKYLLVVDSFFKYFYILLLN